MASNFSAHEHIGDASKISTIIVAGEARALCAESVRKGIYEFAEDENWMKAD